MSLLGYESSYHKQTQDQFGKEEETTFYHTKKEDKKYHIDYIYIKDMNIKSLHIGSYDKWIEHSDHCPVSIEVWVTLQTLSYIYRHFYNKPQQPLVCRTVDWFRISLSP